MRHRAQALCLKARFAQQAYNVGQTLCSVHKAERAARSAQIRCRAAYILQRAQLFAACGGLVRVWALPAASGGKVRRIGNDEIELPGFEQLAAAADIAANDIAARLQCVCGHVFAGYTCGLGVYLKPRHVQSLASHKQQQRQYARAAAEVDAAPSRADIHKVRQQHGVRARPEVLRLLKLRPVFP